MATIYDVSLLAGVSLATVSRVMNNTGRVSDKTRKKVEDAMSSLGYRPNMVAQSLASNRSNSVGILVSELSGPYFGQMMSGIESEVRAAGKHVIITTGHSQEDKEIEGIEFLVSRKCDALILHVEAVSDDYLIALSKQSIPIYLVGRLVPELAEQCISLDNVLGGYLATKTLLEHGHRDIAYIAGPLFKPDARNRLIGHQQALAEFGIRFEDTLFYEGNFNESGGEQGFEYFVASKRPFTAIACANDETAAGAMELAREVNYQLPQDLSIIGFDNIIFAKYLYPRLTTIENPVMQMSQMAARLALKQVFNEKKHQIQHIFEPKVIMRDSLLQQPNAKN
ncbi:LacI family DNA-binding transcriptional regulator [Pseudoalteromonas tunicata]|jgi:LacI family transcriptional regulator|uniref:Galactose operon repressor n=1 Tax=Pseudoalteromonas tunicata D2 TaxID=87626 RepID=A4C564_9GAMM|nr:LacI family DNA-binding transcriptional regulator [Pseudoalteromonas tunicata]ATC96830.1 LacI family transcriptional regulator [Pseudoalteromonas tunicata]AXT32972.1 LacI family DNA-binding transcriptional regulator [Pseudoalteromonas tunicata]EAR30696.1 galactose operon repressor [Pseudoalteromonas tunicata D2]MDP4983701.1 LacI family transcriptional regulator [Pseudoalteromonas tunicata]MDP5212669.1 LacI family DNA-binding transcriptional regulator [Pseudoalteromonas tunicata]